VARRIVPISSGKGGVGKTTLALNYALSLARYGRTLLIDLDTGTSSVRNCLDVSFERDLYHFFKRGVRLVDCVTALPQRLDPRGEFRNFGVIAAPKHLIDDITNFGRERREQLIEAINGLAADFVVLDLKSGLDANVLDFLPYTNSGILVFTPHLPAATLAASDIVKAILFRKLRALFATASPIYADLPGITPRFVNDLLDRVEDVYDSGIRNLDAFVADLQHALGDQPVVRRVAEAVDSFVVHYVLNMFNGVQDSYETAVKPFVGNLADNVSAHLAIFNLGWIVVHPDINRSNIRRVPVLLAADGRVKPGAGGVGAALESLAQQYLDRPVPRRYRLSAKGQPQAPDPASYLNGQLDTLRRMYDDMRGTSYRDNFRYITLRSLHVMKTRGPRDFGDARIFKPSEVQSILLERLRR